MRLENLKDKKILILGFAREGIDSFLFLRKIFPKKIIGVGDKKELKQLSEKAQKIIKEDKKIKIHLGKNYLKFIKNYDVILKSPGIPPKFISPFLTKKQIITSQTEIFLENCKGIVIGITGTKGKSTTASLIYKILKEAKKDVHLIGNIGKPVLSFLLKSTENKIFVYELSSHQLFNLKISPKIAVFLNLHPEHLDYYRNLKDYIKAKANILRWQKKDDFLIYNGEDKIVKEIAKKSKAKKIKINLRKYQNFLKKFKNLKSIPPQNIISAIEVANIFQIDINLIKKALLKFKTLPHRLEYVGRFKGIDFYNDSLSTIPQSTILALNFLGKRVKTLILGGTDRGVDFKNLAKEIIKRKIRTLILFPSSGERILKEILNEAKRRKKKPPFYFFTDSMKEAVKICYLETKKGEICLLSPASPSFSCFKDYKERGNLFKKFVKYFGKK